MPNVFVVTKVSGCPCCDQVCSVVRAFDSEKEANNWSALMNRQEDRLRGLIQAHKSLMRDWKKRNVHASYHEEYEEQERLMKVLDLAAGGEDGEHHMMQASSYYVSGPVPLELNESK